MNYGRHQATKEKWTQSLFSMLGTLIDLTSLFHKHKGYFFQKEKENDRFGLYCINVTRVVVDVKERYDLRNDPTTFKQQNDRFQKYR